MLARIEDAPRLAPLISALSAITVFAWVAMFAFHAGGDGASDVVLVWIAMTVGMMTPSALPMIATYGRLVPALDAAISVQRATSVFIAGYLMIWVGFAVVAAMAQIGMRNFQLMGEHMQLTSPLWSSGFLIAAGLYQLTPLKRVCISKCRSPVGFLLASFRPGYRGAFAMGIRHGAFCIGCCWLLMALVWIGGMANLVWMALLSVLVIAEKTAPHGDLLAKGMGFGLVAAGLACLVFPGSAAWLTDEALISLCRGSP
ncbi:MAG: DUF2182 domain-containing protein [Hyphomicrobium sp.]|jgi:predicted metal-binding membrane protein